MDLLKNTLFINLEHRKDRLEHILKQFRMVGISGERVNAIKMKQGAIGCTMSHIRCLELAKSRNWPQVFICEDDILFTNVFLFKRKLREFGSGTVQDWDVLIIGGNNCPPYEQVNDHLIKVTSCRTTTGYVVKQHYYDTLIANFRESAAQLLKCYDKTKFALDMYWQQLQQKDKWYMLIPATVSQREDYSDIEERPVQYEHLMLDIQKKWLGQPVFVPKKPF